MNNKFKLILSGLFLASMTFLMGSCSDDLVINPSEDVTINKDGTITFPMQLQFPKLNSAKTRTLSDGATLEDLDLYLIVFDQSGLRETVPLKSGSENITVEENEVNFKVNISETESNATLHLIAINKADQSFSSKIANLLPGPEAAVMSDPSLYTEGDIDAYWQRVELGTPISIENIENIKGKLQKVPMIRNFARVSVEENLDNFELLGFKVINTRNRGMIVPQFVNGQGQTQYVDFTSENINKDNYYNSISGQGYVGMNASGALRVNRAEDITEDGWDDTAPKYFFERQQSTNNHTYIIIKGRYNNVVSYYKLDLGLTDEVGIFTYYNLIRNIDFHVKITSVQGKGYDNPQQAVNGAAFNNFSSAVETRNMLNISDGTDMIYVNFTTYVNVDNNQTIDFRYRYLENITSNGGTLNNNIVAFKGLEAGEVIESYSKGEDYTDDNGYLWATIKIKLKDAPQIQANQQFTIYKPNGLNRTITLISRVPWTLSNIETYPGLWADDSRHPAWDPDSGETYTDEQGNSYRYIGAEKGAPLTLFFDLPSGLSEAMFPLEFEIESDRQNIENAQEGSASVITGPSMFDNTDQQRIKYVKTVQWSDYYDIENDTYMEAGQVIRVRFKTITDLNGFDFDDKITTLRIRNKYFEIAEDQFMRDQNTPVVDPDPQVWDFSNSDLSQFISDLADEERNTNYNNTISGLTLSGGNSEVLKSGTTDGGQTYILVSSTNDSFSFEIDNTNGSQNNFTLYLTVSNETDAANGGNVKVPLITANNINTSIEGAYLEQTGDNTIITEINSQTPIRYDLTLPKSRVIFTIKTQDNTPMRFYRIGYLVGKV